MSNFDIPLSLGRKVHVFNSLGFETKSNLDHKTLKKKSQSTRALKQYMNDKNRINTQETRSIFCFSAGDFESDLKYT